MALEGNVRDFGLSEILQLVALQKKTGMLAIEGEQTMVIYFREGLIVSTRDRRAMSHDPLRYYIVRYGILSEEEMARIDRIQAEAKIDLADILLSEKKFSEDELRELFAEQIQESLQEVLAWPRSRYKFVIGSQALHGVRTFGGFKVEGLLMESMRRIDELPELTHLFPSDETLLRRIAPADGTRPELEETEEELFELLETQMTLGDLIPRARMARFCTMETLKQLLEKGLLHVVPVEKPAPAEELIAEKETTARHSARRRPYLTAAAVLAACFAIGEIAVPRALSPGWSVLGRSGIGNASTVRTGMLSPDITGINERILERSIRMEIEEYYALTGDWPPDLGALKEKGLISERSFAAAQRLGLTCRLENGGKRCSLERSQP